DLVVGNGRRDSRSGRGDVCVRTLRQSRGTGRRAVTARRIRPLLVTSRQGDPEQKVGFMDAKWFVVAGGRGAAEATDEAVYLVMSIRNVGSGIGVLHGWHFYPERRPAGDDHAPLEEFVR